MNVLIELQLIAGNLVCVQDTVKRKTYEAKVACWLSLEDAAVIGPLLENFTGERLLSFEVGDACEYGPFLVCYFAGGDVRNINVFCVDAYDGDHIFGRERTTA